MHSLRIANPERANLLSTPTENVSSQSIVHPITASHFQKHCQPPIPYQAMYHRHTHHPTTKRTMEQ